MNSPRLYSTFLLRLLAELFEQLPEAAITELGVGEALVSCLDEKRRARHRFAGRPRDHPRRAGLDSRRQKALTSRLRVSSITPSASANGSM